MTNLLIERGVAETEDYFRIALYYLRDDQFQDALLYLEKIKAINGRDPWFNQELALMEGYCAIKLGQVERALEIASTLPDDIQMIIKVTGPPVKKADLLK